MIVLCAQLFSNGLWWPHTVALAIMMSCSAGIFSASWKRWHWVEHQICSALERSTLAAHLASPITVRCGSSVSCTAALFLVFLVSILDYGFWSLIPFTSLGAYTWYRESYWLGRAEWSRSFEVAVWLVGLPVALVVCSLQRIFFLRRPSKSQEETRSYCVYDATSRILDDIDNYR
jgi:hypothetical protein